MSNQWSVALRSIVRPVVTLAFAAAFIAGFFLGKVSSEAFAGVAGSSIAYWFMQRERRREAPPPPG